MSALSDIQTYWLGNSTLTSAVANLWVGLAPPNTATPYAVLVPVSTDYTFTTGKGYITASVFQISIFAPSLATVDTICQTVIDQMTYKAVGGSANISCELENLLIVQDPDSPTLLYHGALTFRLRENRSLP